MYPSILFILLMVNASDQPRDEIYGPYNASYLQTTGPTTHTSSPIVTGTSVVACKYKDGIVIAADKLGKPTATHQLCP